jgi:regulator of protease activity HflC (stomatin/prohibitin superfamily)
VVGSFDGYDWRAVEAAEAEAAEAEAEAEAADAEAETEAEAEAAEAALLETLSVPLIDTTDEWLSRAR